MDRVKKTKVKGQRAFKEIGTRTRRNYPHWLLQIRRNERKQWSTERLTLDTARAAGRILVNHSLLLEKKRPLISPSLFDMLTRVYVAAMPATMTYTEKRRRPRRGKKENRDGQPAEPLSTGLRSADFGPTSGDEVGVPGDE